MANQVEGVGAPAHKKAVTIANGASLSSEVNLTSDRLAAIQMPAAWTAAALTFRVSYDGENYFDVYDKDGAEYTVTAGASRMILVPVVDFIGFQWLQVRSGTAGTPVNQGAARTLTLGLMQ